jgi:hypothetical protein
VINKLLCASGLFFRDISTMSIKQRKSESLEIIASNRQTVKTNQLIIPKMIQSIILTKDQFEPRKITEEQLHSLVPSFRKESSEKVDYQKIELLFTHKHAQKQQSRQIEVVKKLSKIHENGISLNDIAPINQILKYIMNVINLGSTGLIPHLTDFTKCFRYYFSNIDGFQI